MTDIALDYPNTRVEYAGCEALDAPAATLANDYFQGVKSNG